jgi:hypothetical protein
MKRKLHTSNFGNATYHTNPTLCVMNEPKHMQVALKISFMNIINWSMNVISSIMIIINSIMKILLLLALSLHVATAQTCPSDETATDELGPYYIANAPITRRLAPANELKDVKRRIKIKGTVYGSDCILISLFSRRITKVNLLLFDYSRSSLTWDLQFSSASQLGASTRK